jgi:RNA-directed DNA polymerase
LRGAADAGAPLRAPPPTRQRDETSGEGPNGPRKGCKGWVSRWGVRGAQPQKTQVSLAFMAARRGETPTAAPHGTEASRAKPWTASPVSDTRVMAELVSRAPRKSALQRVKANHGSPGREGMTVEELPPDLQHQWPSIQEPWRCGTSTPPPVTRVERPQPEGGVRTLGRPTVLARCIPHALWPVLPAQGDASCADNRDGFRPHRSAHQAVEQAQPWIAAGGRCVMALDLEQCFDRVNHDPLRGTVAQRRQAMRVWQRIRGCRPAGVLAGGLGSLTAEGTPPGGSRSPL